MRMTIEHERKPERKGGLFTRYKAPLALVHVTIEASEHELLIMRLSVDTERVVYKDYDPDSTDMEPPLRRERILYELFRYKPCTFVFLTEVQAADFEDILKTRIASMVKKILERGLPPSGPTTIEI